MRGSVKALPRLLRHEGGLLVWGAALAGIGLWMVHIVALSSLVEVACGRPWLTWVVHGITLGTGGATALATWWCWELARTGDPDELAGSRAGRQRFVGLFGFLTGATSLLLILWEGSYVLFLDACA